MNTTVVTVRGKNKYILEANPDFVYVGRAVAGTRWTRYSVFHNPFPIKLYPDAIDRFTRLLDDAIEGRVTDKRSPFVQMALELPKIKGKILGCWCGNWKPGDPDLKCHAVVLAKRANALDIP